MDKSWPLHQVESLRFIKVWIHRAIMLKIWQVNGEPWIAPLSISYITLGKLLIPEPKFSYLQNEDSNSHFIEEEGKALRDSDTWPKSQPRTYLTAKPALFSLTTPR